MKSAGVVVGRVESIAFDDKTFQARVTLALESRYAFPKDSSLKILTSGLLGEQYIGIEAGRRRQEPRRRAIPSPRTQSAVVLENLIGQFLYNKAADGAQLRRRLPRRNDTRLHHLRCDACARLCAAARLPGLHPGRCSAVAPPAPPPIRATPSSRSTARCMQFNERVDAIVLKPVATVYQRGRAAAGAHRRQQFLRQPDRRLVVRQQRAAVQAPGRRRQLHAGATSTPSSASAASSTSPANSTSTGTGKTSARPGPLGHARRARTSCCRCSGPPPCATRSRCRSTAGPTRCSYVDPMAARNALYVLRAVDIRANLLRASSVLDEAALDKYSFTRDAYLQRRRAEIFEDDPPTTAARSPGRRPKTRCRRCPSRRRAGQSRCTGTRARALMGCILFQAAAEASGTRPLAGVPTTIAGVSARKGNE